MPISRFDAPVPARCATCSSRAVSCAAAAASPLAAADGPMCGLPRLPHARRRPGHPSPRTAPGRSKGGRGRHVADAAAAATRRTGDARARAAAPPGTAQALDGLLVERLSRAVLGHESARARQHPSPTPCPARARANGQAVERLAGDLIFARADGRLDDFGQSEVGEPERVTRRDRAGDTESGVVAAEPELEMSPLRTAQAPGTGQGLGRRPRAPAARSPGEPARPRRATPRRPSPPLGDGSRPADPPLAPRCRAPPRIAPPRRRSRRREPRRSRRTGRRRRSAW